MLSLKVTVAIVLQNKSLFSAHPYFSLHQNLIFQLPETEARPQRTLGGMVLKSKAHNSYEPDTGSLPSCSLPL